MVDYIHSLASDFYFKQENYKKCREMKSFVAKRLARQNWNSVAVELIEKVKICSLKLHDYESFVQSEFELINVKKENIDVKKKRLNLILQKFEESKEKTNQKFSMNNPLIKVYARFDCRSAEIFDSVTLSIRILSEIDFKFNKMYINFNEKSFNKEIYDEDGGSLQLSEHQTFQNDTTIFIKSQIESDLKLDHIILEKSKGENTLSLLITPTPDINVDNLIFGDSKGELEQEKIDESDDERDGLRLKISDTRQKIDLDINYKDKIFLGELVPIDFTFKCRKR